MTGDTTQTGQRAIRSFVRRTGRMTPGQQRAFERLWPRYGVDVDDAQLDASELFGRAAPLVLEIGFGNGESLVDMAASHREWDFLGIEVHTPGIGHAMLAAEKSNLANLRLACGDAMEILSQWIPDNALSRINLYFPDPWPKARHHKRRILQDAFLDLAAGKLRPGGTLHIAPDWANYAEHIDETMASRDDFQRLERREHGGDQPLDRPTTKFERRGLRLGHRIWDWSYQRVPVSASKEQK